VNPSTVQALVMVDELLRCGVTDAVVAPGARSTPLALALAEAEARGDLRLHVRLDERSAGYLALGLGKASGIPAVVVTTSGTAAVNLLPAIVEADHSAVPLIALTADRPPRLRGVGANQSIEQVALFSGRTRDEIDMAVATDKPGQVAYWRSTVARAVARCTDAMLPGPVSVNVPFDTPLVPDLSSDGWVEELAGRPDGRPWTADARLVAGMSTPLDDVLGALLDSAVVPAHGVIIVGDHSEADSVDLIDDLGDALGWPVIAEPSGNAGGCATALSHGPLLCADAGFMESHVPNIVITVGRVGLHRSVLTMVAAADLHIAVDSRPDWSDPTRSADLVVASVPLPPEAAHYDEQWLADWQRADVLAAAAVETVMSAEGDRLSGVSVARITAQSVPESGLLFLAASSVVRHVSTFAATSIRDGSVLGNRGTSGIDGTLSTAWGSAIAHESMGGGAAIALVGDQAFWYDSNALLVPKQEERPNLTIVVSDNDGGGIFSTLEQGHLDHEEHFERVFGVPLGIDIEAFANSVGVPVQVVSDAGALTAALESAVGDGVSIIVARVMDRAEEAALVETVSIAVASALSHQ
jgi:2-succinyl-5-enolpyruvyl-6-hydroxy-3-cyclohexene-1-carboxylate synthase